MSYENTEVPVSRSQEGIRRLIMSRKGGRVAFISDPPQEGFTAIVEIDSQPYQIKLMGLVKDSPQEKTRKYQGRTVGSKETTDREREKFRESEERRIWRVLFYHLKSVFEAADSGVMEFRTMMLPYIVTKSGKTIAEQIIPKLDEAIERNPSRLLTA